MLFLIALGKVHRKSKKNIPCLFPNQQRKTMQFLCFQNHKNGDHFYPWLNMVKKITLNVDVFLSLSDFSLFPRDLGKFSLNYAW